MIHSVTFFEVGPDAGLECHVLVAKDLEILDRPSKPCSMTKLQWTS